jgi:hypothetical protein
MKQFFSSEIFIGMMVGFFIGMAIAVLLCDLFIVCPLQKKAVESGSAEWKITSNSTGQTKFNWIK